MYHPMEPDYGSTVGVLQHLTVDELKQLLNNEDRLDEMVRDCPQVKSIETEKEMLLASNKSLAEFNLSREPRLRQEKQRLTTTYEDAVQVFNSAESKKLQLEELSKRHSLDTMLAILQTAAAQSEEESEAIAEKFLDGNLEVESFVDSFLGQRKVAHLRRIKVDKLMEILNNTNHHQSTPNQNWPLPPPPAMYGNPASMQLPRPSYGLPM